MCGIVGYIGKNLNIGNFLIEGLRELEYRGYDSAGIAVLDEANEFHLFKEVGKIENLAHKIGDFSLDTGLMAGIAHTRWATHGKPTEANAHPHYGSHSFVVHNGIIENYKEIKEMLSDLGIQFKSQTDTEVITHLFEHNYSQSKNSFDAWTKTIFTLQGSFAVLLVFKDTAQTIFFAKKGSPLLISTKYDGKNYEHFFSSSDAPLIGFTENAIYLDDYTIGFCNQESYELFNFQNNLLTKISPTTSKLPTNKLSSKKNGFRYFMEKEIHEQQEVVIDTLTGRIQNNAIVFDELDGEFFNSFERIHLCACGTSYNSALTASYLFERNSKMSITCSIASEFRYREPIFEKDTLFIVVSQSGETADTLEALKLAKNAGAKTLAICNVDNSSIVRESDYSILTRAGIEKGVASTKAFSTQVLVLWMLSVAIAKEKKQIQLDTELDAIKSIAFSLDVPSQLHERIKRLSKRYLHGHGFFFIGRDVFYPLALEGALKLKEISYLHAEGYPSGEMKHGPIALADPELFTVALLSPNLLFDKTKSNIEELSARESTICLICSEDIELSDDFIETKSNNHYMLDFFSQLVALQLLALEISIRLGNDVDMPRNLAKSVTVE